MRGYIALIVALLLTTQAHAQSVNWSVSATPTLVLGRDGSDAIQSFTDASGATRLPNGTILVGDRGEYSLHLYTSTGKEVKKFGRKGKGPGEFTYLAWLFRCGTSVLAYDTDGSRISVYALDGSLQRSFRFSTKLGGNIPYRSACNRDAKFVHYRWPARSEMKVGAFRTPVPVWLSAADSSTGKSLGTIKGSERWGTPHGSSPLPLGREPRIAIGATRAYIGDAESFEIKVFAPDGSTLESIKKTAKLTAVTSKDISDEIEREVARVGEKERKRVEADFSSIRMPKILPPYRALVVDADDNLWVQNYARSTPNAVTWTVFDTRGTQLTELQLPFTLDVFEIGKDYVLGKYVDPNESVPEVRMYRLEKRSR